MRNPRLVGSVAIAVAMAATIAYVILHPRNAVVQAPATPQVAVATATMGEFTETIGAVGRVGAPAGGQTKVAFPLPGILQSVTVRVGEHVAAGQTLAQLNTANLSLTAQQAQADASAAAANAQAAGVDKLTTKIAVDRGALERAQSLYAAGVGARKDIEAAQAQLAADYADRNSSGAQRAAAAAVAQSASAKAALSQNDLTNAALRAPLDGVVLAILKQPGEAVDPTTPVVALGAAAQSELTLNVAAADALRVRVGDSVVVSVAGSGMNARGRVIGVTPAVDPATQSATVVVSGVPSGSVAGSAVTATIVVGRSTGVLLPQSAIVQDPQSGRTLVFVQTHDSKGEVQFKQRQIVVLHINDKIAQIKGLLGGERVAAQGAFALLAPANGGG